MTYKWVLKYICMSIYKWNVIISNLLDDALL